MERDANGWPTSFAEESEFGLGGFGGGTVQLRCEVRRGFDPLDLTIAVRTNGVSAEVAVQPRAALRFAEALAERARWAVACLDDPNCPAV